VLVYVDEQLSVKSEIPVSSILFIISFSNSLIGISLLSASPIITSFDEFLVSLKNDLT
jgi:hypothetical protein